MGIFLNYRFPVATTTPTLPFCNSASLCSLDTSTTLDVYEGVINSGTCLKNFMSSFNLPPFDSAQGERLAGSVARDKYGSGDRFASLESGVGISGSARVFIGGSGPWRMGEGVSETDLARTHDQRENPTIKIVSFDDPRLNQISSPVTPEDLASRDTQRLIDDLIAIVHEHGDIGISAPQVGRLKRIAVIEYDGEVTVLVNPELKFPDQQKFSTEEACLSFKVSSRIDRNRHVVVRALDRNGKPLEFYTEGEFAALIQHEVDHLDGKLFIDLI